MLERSHLILVSILEAVDELNLQLPKEQQLEKSTETFLFGPLSILDSLGLVNLIVVIEQKIEEKFGILVTLTDEEMMSQVDSPFETIGKLATYISLLLERDHGF